ncbi:MAG: EFR1 family ferrodoxin [Clostridia bacterium]|nr:EFR1 family ferrodoxin [Clostridia bacterium]
MNAVIYYSNTGECRRVAEYLADKSGFDLIDIYDIKSFEFDTAVLVFPVHCQNIPRAVNDFLKRLKVKALVAVALYGKMSFGNVLYEVQKNYRHKIAAAAYIPAKHAYLDEKGFEDFEKLEPLIEKLKNPTEVKIPRSSKNPLADIAPQFRSRAGVKLYADAACNKCGACTAVCKNGGIENGKPNKNCIRCLKCVAACPQNALRFLFSPSMRAYLKKRKKTDLIIYV